MFDYGKLKEAVDCIKNNKDRWQVNFITKHLVTWIYEKIDRTECQLVINISVKISVCTKLMIDLLKLKLKSDKTITVIIIDRIK